MKKLIPYIACLGSFILYEALLNYPRNWPVLAVLFFALIFFSVVYLVRKNIIEFLAFFAGLFFFVFGCFLFLFFIESKALEYTSIFITCLLIFAALRAIYLFFYESPRYVPYSLENIFTYTNLISLFFAYTASFSFWILGIGRLRYLIALVFVSTLILVWQMLWLHKLKGSFWLYSIIFAWLITQGYWALHFWPTSFFVNGLVLLTVFYFLFNIFLHSLKQSLAKKVVVRYFLFSLFVVGITLGTANWL